MWELVSFAQSKIRKICLEALEDGPKTVGVIARASSKHLSHISRAMKELVDKGLVDCLTPALTKNKIYRITKKGKEVLQKLKGMNEGGAK